MFHVIRIHGFDLLPGWCPEYLDYLDKLIYAAFTRKERLAQHQLGHDTSSGPNVCALSISIHLLKLRLYFTDVSGIVRGTEDQLGCTVVPGADIANIGFTCDEDLGRTKITELENTRGGVEEQVLGFYITVANADRVDVCERAQELVHIELDLQHRHRLFKLDIMTRCAINSFWDVFKDEVQVDLIFL